MGFPRRKRKGKGTESCRFTTGAIRVEADRHHVTLPRLGRLHTHESTRKLARRLEQGAARIMAATITRRGGRWYVSFTCEIKRTIVPPRLPRATIGVDVGIRHLAVLSDGRLIGSQRAPSAGWRLTRHRLVREHARVANVRHNGLHQVTSDLVETYGTIVVERLNVAGLLKNRRLAGRLADASLGKLRRQLAYKTTWAGSALVEAERFFPSSKICSGCGHVKAKLPLSEREYRCECCGLVLDRDVNAARNLAVLVDSSTDGVARSGLETRKTLVDGDSRPWLAGPSPMKREAGTQPLGLDQTGTADW
jgi:IS605 OrfB family transposase